jgi:hypothetical protein
MTSIGKLASLGALGCARRAELSSGLLAAVGARGIVRSPRCRRRDSSPSARPSCSEPPRSSARRTLVPGVAPRPRDDTDLTPTCQRSNGPSFPEDHRVGQGVRPRIPHPRVSSQVTGRDLGTLPRGALGATGLACRGGDRRCGAGDSDCILPGPPPLPGRGGDRRCGAGDSSARLDGSPGPGRERPHDDEGGGGGGRHQRTGGAHAGRWDGSGPERAGRDTPSLPGPLAGPCSGAGRHGGVWLAAEDDHRNPYGIPPWIVLCDGERAWHERPGESWPEGVIGVLDLLHVRERWWKVAWWFVEEARPKPAAPPWVETDPRRLLDGKEGVVCGGRRPRMTQRGWKGRRRKTDRSRLSNETIPSQRCPWRFMSSRRLGCGANRRPVARSRRWTWRRSRSPRP